MAKLVTDKDLGYNKIMREIVKADRLYVDVGIHSDAMNEGESVAKYAFYNEFGTETIPDRSFMRSTFDEKKNQTLLDIRLKFQEVQAGKKTTRQTLRSIAEIYARHIRKKIRSNIQPENATSTLKQKDTVVTLIDSGTMLRSIRSKIGSK